MIETFEKVRETAQDPPENGVFAPEIATDTAAETPVERAGGATPKIICVLGPTASGKTALAAALAKALGGEVVGCDSMQIYRTLDVGTAKPTEDEKLGVPHHMIDICDPGESYSVARYVDEATRVIEGIHARGKPAIVAGGTGLYMDSLIRGLDFSPSDGVGSDVRERLNRLAERFGAERLHRELQKRDPAAAERIHQNDVRRIVRALEISLGGGSISAHDAETKARPPRFDALKIGLDYRDRAALYARIDLRAELMLRDGVLDEARRLFETDPATARQAIGYKELLPALDDRSKLDECVALLQQSSRRYAKRQLTWFRRDKSTHWFYPDEAEFSEILRLSTALAREFLYN